VRRATTTGMDLPTYRAVLQSARRLGVPVVGHIPASIGLQTAIIENQNLAHIVMYLLRYFVPIQDRLFQGLALLGVISTIVLILWALAALMVRWRTQTRLQPDIGTGIIVAFAAAAVALALASLQWLGQTALIMLLTMMGAAILCGTIGLIISAEKGFRVGPGSGRSRFSRSRQCRSASV
jgi:hypothetical protein